MDEQYRKVEGLGQMELFAKDEKPVWPYLLGATAAALALLGAVFLI